MAHKITFWVHPEAYLEPKFQSSSFKNGQNTAMHREGCYFVIFFKKSAKSKKSPGKNYFFLHLKLTLG